MDVNKLLLFILWWILWNLLYSQYRMSKNNARRSESCVKAFINAKLIHGTSSEILSKIKNDWDFLPIKGRSDSDWFKKVYF